MVFTKELIDEYKAMKNSGMSDLDAIREIRKLHPELSIEDAVQLSWAMAGKKQPHQYSDGSYRLDKHFYSSQGQHTED